ncbi:MAG: CHAT domain-containing protein, partial [Myxococcales bacterium]|nr:CHAT domain-containing protein [Myxococcales bacterium]
LDGDRRGALARLDAVTPGLSGAARADALRLRGDLYFRSEDNERALAAYAQAMDALVAVGQLRAASDVALTASFLCSEVLLDLERAAGWLTRHEALLERLPEARLRHSYYRGLLGERRGDLRAALVDYQEHAALAEKLGLWTDVFAARSAEAVLLARIGREADSAAALERARAVGDAVPLEMHGKLLNNTAWARLLALESGRPAADPRPLLDEALALLGPGGPAEDPASAGHVLVNLAHAAVLRGDVDGAREALAALAGRTLDLRPGLWRELIVGRLALLERRFADALAAFERLDLRAAESGGWDLAWHAAIGRGQALEGSGRPREALDAYAEAESWLDEQLSRIALEGGRERFSGTHDLGARHATTLLVARGDLAGALCVARRARLRAHERLAREARHRLDDPAARSRRERAFDRLARGRAAIEAEFERSWTLPRRDGERLRATLAARGDALRRELDAALADLELAPYAAVTCDALARPEPGELLLAYAPSVTGWFVFADDGVTLQVTALSERVVRDASAGLEGWGAALLDPVADAIASAQRLRILAAGPLLEVPFAELPLGDARLGARVPIVHALDLPALAQADEAPASALVLAPTSNLAHAAEEAEDVAAALSALDLDVDALLGEEAVGVAARERLIGLGLLHFAGHARAGAGPWEAALEMSGETSITVADIIALPGPAPRHVVLSGCETGLVDPAASGGGMSLAHAFLVAGARSVLATDAVVDDARAGAVIASLYAALVELPELDLAAALQAAQARAHADGDCDDGLCGSFRVWVR